MEDRLLNLAVGYSAGSTKWRNQKMTWTDLAAKLSESKETSETLKEFLQANKEDQKRIKDVGGYVGGYLRNGKRGITNVSSRSILTLDVDFATSDFFETVTMLFECALCLHGTHKNSPTEPRYRLIIPLDRDVTPDEYGAISRRVAGRLNIELFDNTTFEVNRLMFWPSNPRDVTYYFEIQHGALLNADQVLASYEDWRDTSTWPTSETAIRQLGDRAAKQADPYEKTGILGAFCRANSIPAAIEKYISDIYVPTSVEGRYTYTKGSTSSGVIIYEDKFSFSHHGTDPAGGQLCNAFDLVRIHLYSHLDNPGSSSKSYAAMESLAMKDEDTRQLIARESLAEVRDRLGDLSDLVDSLDEIDFMATLEIDNKGNYLSSATNISDIMSKDPILKGAFRHNAFKQQRYITRSVPWRSIEKPEPMKNVDYAGLRNYIESVYKINSGQKIEDSLALEAERLAWHPVKDFLESLEWDGVKRIDTAFSDYLGAEEGTYTSLVSRKLFTGAVARIFEPGCKYELVPTLVGRQGSGKSSFFSILCGEWFSDTFMGVSGKEAFEQLQGAWVIEIAELAGFKKAEVNDIKKFISKQVDEYRPAYGRTREEFYRQCIFVATTNETDFLVDQTGNRRFLPVEVDESLATKSVFKDLRRDSAQLWAEAVELYRAGEKLYLTAEEKKIAEKVQERHTESDDRTGLIVRYLDKLLPPDWDSLDKFERRDFIEGDTKGEIRRTQVCVAEIWCECLGKSEKDLLRYNTREINAILRNVPGWREVKSTKTFKHYGTQRYYERL